MASTKDALDHHKKCFGEGDLKGILSDYAHDAVLFTPDGPLRGVDAISPLFQRMFAEFGKPGAVFSMQQESVDATMLTFCGRQRLPTTCTRLARTRSSCGTARSWRNRSPARSRPSAENTFIPEGRERRSKLTSCAESRVSKSN